MVTCGLAYISRQALFLQGQFDSLLFHARATLLFLYRMLINEQYSRSAVSQWAIEEIDRDALPLED